MDLVDIQPKKIRIKIFGQQIALTVQKVTTPDAREWLNPFVIGEHELGDIGNALLRHCSQGEFEAVSSTLRTRDGLQPIKYYGTWYVMPDFSLFLRIFRWWYNYQGEEALTLQTFEQTYGSRMGAHYLEKWNLYERSIPAMIGYFGSNPKDGQLFLDMVMLKVLQYERRSSQEA